MKFYHCLIENARNYLNFLRIGKRKLYEVRKLDALGKGRTAKKDDPERIPGNANIKKAGAAGALRAVRRSRWEYIATPKIYFSILCIKIQQESCEGRQ